MFTMPRTTYTFNAYTYDEDSSDTTDVKVEWTTQEETIQDLCDKFADFVRGAGFGYVTSITYETEIDTNTGFIDDEWDWTSEQPEVDDSQLEFNFSPVTPYGDIKVTYGNSIDDATPEEWNAASRSVWDNSPK